MPDPEPPPPPPTTGAASTPEEELARLPATVGEGERVPTRRVRGPGEEKTRSRHWEPLIVLPRELGQVPPPPSLVGNKAHGLAQLLVLKARTPRFGVLTRAAFDLHIAQPVIREVVEEARRAELTDEAQRAAWGERLGRLCAATPLPDEVEAALEELLAAFPDGDRLAVRASAVAPLADAAALRGAFETSLFVAGAEDVREAVLRSFGSAFGVRALHARYDGGLDPLGTHLAVVLQRMVDAEVSGACTSLDAAGPPGQDPQCLVRATFGLAGGMSRGPGSARIHLDTARVIRPVVPDEGIGDSAEVEIDPEHKPEAIRFDAERGRGTRITPLDDDKREVAALSPVQSRMVAAEALRIEAALGRPQEIEFAFAGRLLHVLQVAPVFLPTARIESTVLRGWDERLLPEGVRGVTTPLSFSVFRSIWVPAFAQAMERLGGPAQDVSERRAVLGRILGLLGGRVYVNVAAHAAFLDLLPEGALLQDGYGRALFVRGFEKPEDGRSLDSDTLKVGRLLKTSRKVATELDAILDDVGRRLRGLDREEYDDKDPDRILDALDEATALGRRLETEHLVTDGCAVAFFGVLDRMIKRWLPQARPGLVHDLFAGEETEESRRISTVVRRLANVVTSDPVLRHIFEHETDGAGLLDRLDGLPAADPLWAEVRAGVKALGSRFLVERKLEAPGLSERPDVLFELVRARVLDPKDEGQRMQTAEGVRKKAEYHLFDQLPDKRMGIGRTSRKKLLERVLKETRDALARRRAIRGALLGVLGLCRRLSLVLGQRLFEHTVLAQPTDVFYLSIDELRGLVRGTALDPDPKPVIAGRKRNFLRLPSELPEAFETVGVLATADLAGLVPSPTRPPAPGERLVARPASSGEVVGPIHRLRIREDSGGFEVMSGFKPPRPGGVLVVRRPDPGLLPVLLGADGVIFERGDLLSPAVVTLRALGVPCVVGLPGALHSLEEGTPVRLDGRTGVVELLPREASGILAEVTRVDPHLPPPVTDLMSHALSSSRVTTVDGLSAEHDADTHLFGADGDDP